MNKREAIELVDDKMCWGRGTWSAHHVPERDKYWEAGEMAIRALEKDEWISVTERLPETDDKVLCCTAKKNGQKNIVIGYYIADKAYWACGMNSNVVAWRPLPEPYESEEEQ